MKKISTIDLVGSFVLGTIVLGLLSLFLFSGVKLRLIVFVLGIISFGLYQMVGYSKKEQLKCNGCGYESR